MNILITCSGKRNYLIDYFKDVIGNRGKVVAANSIEDVSSMYQADIALKAPGIADPRYIPFLLETCEKHSINLLLSLFDQDLSVISRNIDMFRSLNTFVAVSDYTILDCCFDKLQLGNLIECKKLKIPKTYIGLESFEEAYFSNQINFPIVIKPRFGTGSIATDICRSFDELTIVSNYLDLTMKKSYIKTEFSTSRHNSLIYQEFIQGNEYNLDIINDFQGRHLTTFVKKKLLRGKSEHESILTQSDEVLSEAGKIIGEYVKHIGIMDADIIRSPDGLLYVIDLNPRFGGGYPFSHAAGANIPKAYVMWVNGNEVPLECFKFKDGLHITKGIEIFTKT